MNVLNILKYIVIILLTMFVCSCNKEKNGIDEFENMICSDDPENSIIGKWKLVKCRTNIMFTHGGEIIDYSQNNIIYEFKKDGTVIISCDIDDYLYLVGEHSYKFEPTLLNSIPPWGSWESGLDLIFHHNHYYSDMYCISVNLMILDLSPLDGETTYFKKLTQ